jgi:putative FmdB family regulatory protein
MPVYEFQCEICGEVFEKVSSINGSLPEVTCPQGHSQVHRVYSAPTIIFRGSGFYVNDSRSKASKPSKKD